MFIGWILKKFSKHEERKQIIREIIYRLSLEKEQEQLYLDSLEVLDDEYLDMFYKKLVALIDIIEEKEVITSWEKQTSKISAIRTMEENETKNTESFNILFDNI